MSVYLAVLILMRQITTHLPTRTMEAVHIPHGRHPHGDHAQQAVEAVYKIDQLRVKTISEIPIPNRHVVRLVPVTSNHVIPRLALSTVRYLIGLIGRPAQQAVEVGHSLEHEPLRYQQVVVEYHARVTSLDTKSVTCKHVPSP